MYRFFVAATKHFAKSKSRQNLSLYKTRRETLFKWRARRVLPVRTECPPPLPLPLRADTGVAASASVASAARPHTSVVPFSYHLKQFLFLLSLCAGASLKCVCSVLLFLDTYNFCALDRDSPRHISCRPLHSRWVFFYQTHITCFLSHVLILLEACFQIFIELVYFSVCYRHYIFILRSFETNPIDS